MPVTIHVCFPEALPAVVTPPSVPHAVYTLTPLQTVEEEALGMSPYGSCKRAEGGSTGRFGKAEPSEWTNGNVHIPLKAQEVPIINIWGVTFGTTELKHAGLLVSTDKWWGASCILFPIQPSAPYSAALTSSKGIAWVLLEMRRHLKSTESESLRICILTIPLDPASQATYGEGQGMYLRRYVYDLGIYLFIYMERGGTAKEGKKH